MDFRAEATIDAVRALIEARLVILISQAGSQHNEYGEYERNRKIVLQAAEKTWNRVRQLWMLKEYPFNTDEMEVAIMIGFRKAVETRQEYDISEADHMSNEIVGKFVESFSPKALL